MFPLEKLCEINIGRTPSRNRSEYWGLGYPWLSIADMNQGRDLEITKENITDLAVRECKCRPVPVGTVLLSFKLSIGKVGISRISLFTNEAIAALPIRDSNKLSSDYLYWALQSIDLKCGLDRAAKGLTLNKAKLADVEIPIPPLSDQKRIADILDRAEALRAKRRAALIQLDELIQSLFIEMFGDPITNPKGWPKKPFSDVCVSRLGKMLDQKQQTGKHFRPYLRNANVQWFHFDLTEVFEMDFNEAAREEFRLKDGDLLICEGGEPGRAAIWKGELEECYYQKALHCARPHKDLANSEYLAWFLWFLSVQGGLGDHVTAATIAHLTGEKLKAMKILLPPIDLQKEFARRVAAVEKLKAAHKASLAELEELFSSLQYRAFRGEL